MILVVVKASKVSKASLKLIKTPIQQSIFIPITMKDTRITSRSIEIIRRQGNLFKAVVSPKRIITMP